MHSFSCHFDIIAAHNFSSLSLSLRVIFRPLLCFYSIWPPSGPRTQYACARTISDSAEIRNSENCNGSSEKEIRQPYSGCPIMDICLRLSVVCTTTKYLSTKRRNPTPSGTMGSCYMRTNPIKTNNTPYWSSLCTDFFFLN